VALKYFKEKNLCVYGILEYVKASAQKYPSEYYSEQYILISIASKLGVAPNGPNAIFFVAMQTRSFDNFNPGDAFTRRLIPWRWVNPSVSIFKHPYINF